MAIVSRPVIIVKLLQYFALVRSVRRFIALRFVRVEITNFLFFIFFFRHRRRRKEKSHFFVLLVSGIRKILDKENRIKKGAVIHLRMEVRMKENLSSN